MAALADVTFRLTRSIGGDRPSTAMATMRPVPRISEFYGIVIAMYYREHGVRFSTRATPVRRSSRSTPAVRSLGRSRRERCD
jgi:hypothetical protein